jgi:uncharacterized protein YeaO (DUF488 family)
VFEEPDYEVELLPLNALTLDWDALPEGMESVNRRPDMNWVKALDKNYNPYVLGLFIVWRNPDGKLIIIDGQHRYLAGIEAGYKWPVIVQIHSDLTRALAAHIFTQANTRRGLNSIEKFRKAVQAGAEVEGYEEQVGVNEVLAARRLQVGYPDAAANGNQYVTCPVKLRQAFKQHGAKWLGETLDMWTTAFPDESRGRVIATETIAAWMEITKRYAEEERKPQAERMSEVLSEGTFTGLIAMRDRAHKENREYTKTWYLASIMIDRYNEDLPRNKKLATWYHVAGH